MIRESIAVAIISRQPDLAARIQEIFENHPALSHFLCLSDYPSSYQMEPLTSVPACILFLDFSDPIRARAVAAEVDGAYPNVFTVAVHAKPGQWELLDLMKIGIREVIGDVTDPRPVVEAFDHACRKLDRSSGAASGAPVFAFLPSRPGTGATTLAVQVSAAAARLANCRTLLIDFDLRLGMTSFLLKLNGERSVLDALSLTQRLDDNLWDGLVNHRGMLDILGSAPSDFSEEHVERNASALLHFARQRYYSVCVDLPGEMREHEIATLQQAQEIFLVCTPEVSNMHMARRKADALRALGVSTRVTAVVNRSNERGHSRVPLEQLESLLTLPVKATIPFAEPEVAAATRDASPISPRTPMGREIERLAQRIMVVNAPPPAQPAKTKKFLDFFSVSEARQRIARR